MAVGGTTIGPLSEETRDLVKEYRDREGYPNYETALRSLLEDQDTNVCQN